MAQHKNFLLLIVVFFAVIVAYGAWTYHKNNVQPVTYAGQIDEFEKNGVPNFALPLLDGPSGSATGKFLKLANLEDQVVLVNFWASWCAPCKIEFPSLIKLASKYNKGGEATAQNVGEFPSQRLRVVAVTVDADVTALHEFLAANKEPIPSNFEIVADPSGGIAARFGTKKLPETYILGKDHKLLRKVIDQQNWISPEFLAILEKFMSPSK